VPDREYGLERVATYVTCAGCGTLYQQPMPDTSELPAYYPAEYHSQVGQGPLGRLRHDVRLRRLTTLATGASTGDGALLDFGCGNGAFLRRAAAARPGREYYGFEIADRPEVVSLDGGAVTIFRGDLDALFARLPPCRIITMNHVIEHLPDPLGTLSRLAEALAPDGLLEGQTPAAGSLEHRVFGTRWSGYHAPRHTVVFSEGGLATVLARAGLTEISVKGAFNPAGLAVSLASVPHRGGPRTVRRQGLAWLGCLGMATVLGPIDLLSRAPGIVDFVARRARS
jgi:SAM-dependent methyltransferase